METADLYGESAVPDEPPKATGKCPVCETEFVWEEDQWTRDCSCGFTLRRRPVVRPDKTCVLCGGKGALPYISQEQTLARPGGEILTRWGILCPSCPAGRCAIAEHKEKGEVIPYQLPEHLPFYSEWEPKVEPLYWRFITDKAERMNREAPGCGTDREP